MSVPDSEWKLVKSCTKNSRWAHKKGNARVSMSVPETVSSDSRFHFFYFIRLLILENPKVIRFNQPNSLTFDYKQGFVRQENVCGVSRIRWH